MYLPPILDMSQDVNGNVENVRNKIIFPCYLYLTLTFSSLHCCAIQVIVTVVIASFVPCMAASIILNVKEVSLYI